MNELTQLRAGKPLVTGNVTLVPIERTSIQSDNGSEFLREFHKLRNETNTTHYFTYPRCPKQNGRVERLIQTSEYEYWDYQDDLIPELDYLREKTWEWNVIYNTYRPHQSLGYKTPLEFYQKWLEDNPRECVKIKDKLDVFIKEKVYCM